MAQLKLILLDFDGTLVDTRRANALAYIETLRERGVELSEEEYLRRFFGVRCIEFMQMVGFTDMADIQQLRQRKVKLYPNYFNHVRLNAELWEWCQMLRHMGFKVYIVSTGLIENIRNVMHHLGLEDGVDGIISGDDVSRPKPYPDCFLLAMEREGVTPEECIIYEDSEVGLEAAKRSGATYVKIAL